MLCSIALRRKTVIFLHKIKLRNPYIVHQRIGFPGC